VSHSRHARPTATWSEPERIGDRHLAGSISLQTHLLQYFAAAETAAIADHLEQSIALSPSGPGLSVTVCTKCDLGLQNADHTRQRRPIRVTTRQPVVFRNQIGKRLLNRPQPCSCFQPFHQLG
jgi:hypothetical protein